MEELEFGTKNKSKHGATVNVNVNSGETLGGNSTMVDDPKIRGYNAAVRRLSPHPEPESDRSRPGSD